MGQLRDSYSSVKPLPVNPTGGSSSPQLPTPNLPKKTEQESFLKGLWKAVTDPAKKYTQMVTGAAIQAPAAVLSGGKLNTYKVNPLLGLPDEDLKKFQNPKSAAIEATKRAAGAASYVLPGGTSTNLAKSVGLAATSGVLNAVAQDEVTPESVATSAVIAAPFGAIPVAGKYIGSKVSKVFQKPVQEAVESVAEKTVPAAVPETMGAGLYKSLPKAVKETLKIAGKETKEIINQGGKIETPSALAKRVEQIRKGGISLFPSLNKLAAKEVKAVPTPKVEPSWMKQLGISFKEGVDAFMKNAVSQSSKVLGNMGQFGKVLSKQMLDVRDVAERRTGQTIFKFGNLLKDFTPEEDDLLVKYLDEGIDPRPIGPGFAEGVTARAEKVKQVGDVIRGMLDNIADEAEKLGIKTAELGGMGYKKTGFKRLENYFPHIFPPGTFDSEEVRTRILNNLVTSGEADNIADAEKLLNQILKRNSPKRFGSLEFSRYANIDGWIKDPVQALTIYFDRAYRRLEAARRFGAENERASALLSKIKEPKNFEQATAIFNRTFGVDNPTEFLPGTEKELLSPLQSFQVSKLGLSAITNLGQTYNTVIAAGLRPTIKAFMNVFKDEGRDFTLKTGAILDTTMREIADAYGGGTLGSKFLQAVKFTATEKFNRSLAANAGKYAALDAFEEVQRKGTSTSAGRMLNRMGVNLTKALNRGYLNESDLLKAGQKMSNLTQFRVAAVDVPYFWSNRFGRLLTQFKAFSYKQAQFIKDYVIDEARQGNFQPLIRMVAFSQLLGEPLADIKAAIRGKDPARKDVEANLLVTKIDGIPARVWDNFATLGAFGLISDLLSATEYGRIPEFVLGPTFGDAVTAVDIGKQTIQREEDRFEPLAKEVTRRIPVVGPLVKNKLFPSVKPKKAKLSPTSGAAPR